jgi:KaiC/GvpD/RAD55 family RecA-like ATPase
MAFVVKVQCPRCAAHGRDRSGDNFAVYEDGGAHCFACGYHVTGRGQAQETIDRGDILELPNVLLDISKEVYEQYRVILKEYNGKYYVCYPYVDALGNVAKYKTRSYKPDTGTLNRDFRFNNVTTEQHITLFNYQALLATKQKVNVMLFEGERDLMMFHNLYGCSNGWLYLALPGTSNMVNALSALNNTEKVQKVYVVMDDDEAGKEATFQAQEMLTKEGYYNTLALDKDITDCIIAGKMPATFDDFVAMFTNRIVPFVCTNPAQELLDYREACAVKPIVDISGDMPSLAKLFKPRKGMMTVWAGKTGRGKSFMVDWFILKAIQNRQHILLVSLEMSPGEIYTRLLHQLTGVYYAYAENVDKALQQTIDTWCLAFKEYLHVSTHPKPTFEIIEKQLSALNNQVSLVVIDTLSLFANDLDWKVLNKVAYDAKRLALNKMYNRPMVLCVSQVSSRGGKELSAESAFGAESISQAVDCMLGIDTDTDTPGDPVTTLKILKRDRAAGKFGSVRVMFDFNAGNFYEVAAVQSNNGSNDDEPNF